MCLVACSVLLEDEVGNVWIPALDYVLYGTDGSILKTSVTRFNMLAQCPPRITARFATAYGATEKRLRR